MLEPNATALLLGTAGLLLGGSALLSRLAARTGLPVAFLFLGVGMLAGSDGLGKITFEDYPLAFRLGTCALVLILFDGGLNTPLGRVRPVLAPAALLATLGVVGTAGVTAVAARFLFHVPWTYALLLGAILSSTDAAAVFSVLRSSGTELKAKVGTLLEVESGLNDPMAVILTLALTESLVSGLQPGPRLLAEVALQLVVGGVVGGMLGALAARLVQKVALPAPGLVAVVTVAFALVTFGFTTLLHGSGFLAVYLAGMALGHGALPDRQGLLRVHDGLAWLAQVAMFLMLGLLVFPAQLPAVALPGTVLALVLAFVARPLVVGVCLLPFGYSWKERLYIGWVGLRGAVPIILATFPVLADVPGSTLLFNVVFFSVVVSGLLPGATVSAVSRWLGVQAVR
ncbi:MAG: potassium/proton antiporter [Myxococcaceae bacterium]